MPSGGKVSGRRPLTRRALAAWVRFAQAQDEEQERNVARFCNLAPADVTSLRILRDNLAELGDREKWWEGVPNSVGVELRAAVLPALLAGLILRPRVAHFLARVLEPHPFRRERLAEALETYAQEEIEMEEPVEMPVAEEEPAPRPPTLIDRLRAHVQRHEWDLAHPVPLEWRNALARELGTSRGTVDDYLRRLRRDQGLLIAVQLPANGNGSTKPRAPRRPAPPPASAAAPSCLPPLRALVRALLRIGIENVEPASLRDDLEAVALAAFAAPEAEHGGEP